MMRAVALTSEADKDRVRSLYRKTYFMAKILGFFSRSHPSRYVAFGGKLQ